MAVHEAADAVLKRLLGAGRDEPDADLARALAEHLGERDQDGAGGEVVVGAGDGLRAPHVADRRDRSQIQDERRLREAAASRQRAEQAQDRPGEGAPPLRRLGLDLRDHGREALVEGADRRLVEQEAGLGGVVMGEDDERVGGVRVARLGQHVHGRLLLAHRAAEDPRAVQHLVEEARVRP